MAKKMEEKQTSGGFWSWIRADKKRWVGAIAIIVVAFVVWSVV